MSSPSWSSSEAESETRFSVQEANLRGDVQEARETGEGRKGRRKSQERWSLWEIGFHLCQDPEAQRLEYPVLPHCWRLPPGVFPYVTCFRGRKAERYTVDAWSESCQHCQNCPPWLRLKSGQCNRDGGTVSVWLLSQETSFQMRFVIKIEMLNCALGRIKWIFFF